MLWQWRKRPAFFRGQTLSRAVAED